MKQLDLSIVVAVKDGERTIRACLESIGHVVRDSVSYEILVMINGSKDRTLDIVDELSRDHASRIAYKNILESGRSNARNIGIKAAAGKYIMFLDADDYFIFQKVDRAIDYLDKHPDIFAVTTEAIIQTGIKKILVSNIGFTYKRLENRNVLPISSVLFRNSNLFPFCTDMYIYEDWVFWAQNLDGKDTANLHFKSSLIIHGPDNTTYAQAKNVISLQIYARSKIRNLWGRRSIVTCLKDFKKLFLFCIDADKNSKEYSSIRRSFPLSFDIVQLSLGIPPIKKICERKFSNLVERQLDQYI